MKKLLKATVPFSALGAFFLAIGLAVGDSRHVQFGIVWMCIAVVALVWRRIRQGPRP